MGVKRGEGQFNAFPPCPAEQTFTSTSTLSRRWASRVLAALYKNHPAAPGGLKGAKCLPREEDSSSVAALSLSGHN